MTKSQRAVLSLVLMFIGFGLAIYWYGWRLAVVNFILMWALNVDNSVRDKS